MKPYRLRFPTEEEREARRVAANKAVQVFFTYTREEAQRRFGFKPYLFHCWLRGGYENGDPEFDADVANWDEAVAVWQRAVRAWEARGHSVGPDDIGLFDETEEKHTAAELFALEPVCVAAQQGALL